MFNKKQLPVPQCWTPDKNVVSLCSFVQQNPKVSQDLSLQTGVQTAGKLQAEPKCADDPYAFLHDLQSRKGSEMNPVLQGQLLLAQAILFTTLTEYFVHLWCPS